MRTSVVLCVFIVAVAAQGPAMAQKQKGDRPMKIKAERHFNRALKLFREKKFKDAAGEFERAHTVDPRPDILFAWAQAERISGDCDKAVELYNDLRELDLPPADSRAVLEGLERCDAVGRQQPPPDEPKQSPPPETDPGKAEAMAKTEAPSAEGSPWWTDPIGDVFLVTGVIGLGVGTGFYVVSSSDRSAAEDATSYETHVVLQDRAKKRRLISIVALSASGVLITGALVRYLLRDDDSAPATTASVWSDGVAAGLAFGGSF